MIRNKLLKHTQANYSNAVNVDFMDVVYENFFVISISLSFFNFWD